MSKKVRVGVVLVVGLVFAGMVVSGAFGAKKLSLLTEEASPEAMDIMDRTIKAYQAKHPDVQIIPEYITWDEFYPRMMVSIAAGNPPEIIKTDVNETNELVVKGWLLPMTDVIDRFGAEDFMGYSRCVIDGKDWTLPVEYGSDVLYYRKDWFTRAGLETPKSWKNWLEAASALTEDVDGDGRIDRWGQIVPMNRTRCISEFFLNLLWGNDATVMAEEEYEELGLEDITLEDPKTKEALVFLKKLYHYSPPGAPTYSWTEMRNVYYTGKVAMTMYEGRVLHETRTYAPEIAAVTRAVFVPTPTGEPGRTAASVGGYVVSKGCKYPEEAKDFIAFMGTGKWFVEFLHSVPGHYIPPMKSVVRSDEYWDHPVFKKYGDIIKTLIGANERGIPLNREWRTPNPVTSEVIGGLVLTDMIQDYVVKGTPIDEALSKCIEVIKEHIPG